MKITRENHASFMTKAMPLLTLAYFVQAYFYLKYAPDGLAQEVVGFVGVSLVGVFLFYFVHDHYHQIILHPHHMEISFAPLKMQKEYSYRDIADVEIEEAKRKYHHVKIHLRNGEVMKLSHVDDAHTVRKYLLERS